MKQAVILLCLALITISCATGGAVRELGIAELEVIQAVDERLKRNEEAMRGAARNLGELGAEYAEKEFVLALALAKAKRLESMRAPWTSPSEEFAETERAVVLYHLYQVEMAEQNVLEARMQERRAAAQELLTAYQRMRPLLKGAAQNMEVVLKYLNQPNSARILAFTENFLGEVTAFREALQADSPRLRKFAEDVARYEEVASRAKQQADMALNAILRPRRN